MASPRDHERDRARDSYFPIPLKRKRINNRALITILDRTAKPIYPILNSNPNPNNHPTLKRATSFKFLIYLENFVHVHPLSVALLFVRMRLRLRVLLIAVN